MHDDRSRQNQYFDLDVLDGEPCQTTPAEPASLQYFATDVATQRLSITTLSHKRNFKFRQKCRKIIKFLQKSLGKT